MNVLSAWAERLLGIPFPRTVARNAYAIPDDYEMIPSFTLKAKVDGFHAGFFFANQHILCFQTLKGEFHCEGFRFASAWAIKVLHNHSFG